MPPSNYSSWKVPDFLREALSGLLHRDPETGAPLSREAESSSPRYGVTAWDEAQVTLRECKIMNMTYNGVCCLGESSVTMEDCEVTGCRMAGVYLEGSANASLARCLLQVSPRMASSPGLS